MSAPTGRASADGLDERIGRELARAAPASVVALAAELARRAGPAAHSVLFYGSTLASPNLDGILDFYVLLDAGRWPGSRLGAIAHRVLPPMVGYSETTLDGQLLRAKYATMRFQQFRRRMRRDAWDTTLWTRFSQPSICVWHRSDQALAELRTTVARAVSTAAYWAAVVGPARGSSSEFWRALYAQTYAAELRVESSARGTDLVERRAAYFEDVLRPAWRAGGIAFDESAAQLEPQLSERDRQRALRHWRLRMRIAKPANILRLIKAAFTFDGATDYVAWKVQRHAGVRIDVRPWQRRFPLLAAPGLYWRLRRRGVLR